MFCVWGTNIQKLIISKIEILEARVKFQGLGAEGSVKKFSRSSFKEQILLETPGEELKMKLETLSILVQQQNFKELRD